MVKHALPTTHIYKRIQLKSDGINPPPFSEQIRWIRRTLGLSQRNFAETYRIPVRTLREWERGIAEPDKVAQAYLVVIACDPDAVRRALRPPETDPEFVVRVYSRRP
jgi:DNA-binding transcriptional regulator YiaG